ncbi:MAG TPA: universal stress protein [Opitutaceae bacterium]|jgi:nucleotide-binding universal stress UspA family protein|nr:universal stress protein [Opitutaceae bacterium]
MKILLVPLDFSATSVGLLQTAATLAQSLDARLVVLHVLQPIAPIGDPMMMPDMAQIASMQKAAEKDARAQLTRACEKVAELGVAVEPELRDGPASAVILERARALPADLVVMGSHGHTALYDLLLGSTSHAVLKKSPCPVVIVPSKK